MTDSGANDRTVDEQDLVRRLKLGQEWAFEVLVKRFEKRLLALAYGITLDREESLEIVQDVFVSVHKNIDQFKGDSKLSTWLRKITVNMSLNWKRKWKRRFRWDHQPFEPETGDPLTDAEKNSETPETLFQQQEMETVLMKHINGLPEKLRTVFVLKTVEGISYEEIASTLGIKIGTVSSRMHHARSYLMEAVNRDSGYHPEQTEGRSLS